MTGKPPAAAVTEPAAEFNPPLSGADLVREEAAKLPLSPGIYQMINRRGEVLYVGKARRLRLRVSSYARPARLTARIRRMVADAASIECVTTRTEAEALLLESNLIKSLKPRYNILLRDDKRFPDIRLTVGEAFPRLVKYRGSRKEPGRYFGPFASTQAVNRTLAALQQMFLLRICSDGEFSRRTRPCLQYQIKRCSAPCTGEISQKAYTELVEQALGFLSGKSEDVRTAIQRAMDEAALARDYEIAARTRDRLRALAQVTAQQHVNFQSLGDADVIAIAREHGVVGVQIFFLRAGQHNGSRSYFPRVAEDTQAGEALRAFIGQFYASSVPPGLLLVSMPPPEQSLLEEVLATRAGRRVAIRVPQQGAGRQAIDRAVENVRGSLARRIGDRGVRLARLEDLRLLLEREEPIERIEAFDNSHIQGKAPVGSLIALDHDGFDRSTYRKFNMRGAGGAIGDDYAMMREMLERRFLKESRLAQSMMLPDVILIDGGKGQVGVAREVLQRAGLEDRVTILGIAKGSKRHAGRETLFRSDPHRPAIRLEERDPLLHFLQVVRDEVHRFAIGTHREKRRLVDLRSRLDEISGVGQIRRRALLRHFGSMDAVSRAGPEDLAEVYGISKTLAYQIHELFHAREHVNTNVVTGL